MIYFYILIDTIVPLKLPPPGSQITVFLLGGGGIIQELWYLFCKANNMTYILGEPLYQHAWLNITEGDQYYIQNRKVEDYIFLLFKKGLESLAGVF